MAQRLFVGNLPRSVTDNVLSEFVTNAGFQVVSAAVIRDKMTGESRGFGFVELTEEEDMQRAIQGLNGQALEGRPLTVNEARPQRAGFGGGGGGGGGSHRGGGAAVARATGVITNEFLPVRWITAHLFRTTPVSRALRPQSNRRMRHLNSARRRSSPEGRLFQPLFTGVESSTMDDPERCAEWTFAGGVVSGGAAKQLPNACQSAAGRLRCPLSPTRPRAAGGGASSLGVGLGLCVFFCQRGAQRRKRNHKGYRPATQFL